MTSATIRHLACLLAAVLLAGCLKMRDSKPDDGLSSTSLSGEPAIDPFHNLSFDEALKRSAIEARPVMVDFYADWCSPCRQLDATTWKDPEVSRWLSDKTIAIKIDIVQQRELAIQHNIRSIPAMVFFKPDGTEIGRIVGYRNARQFEAEANELLAGTGQ